jgi:hypothetical protein
MRCFDTPTPASSHRVACHRAGHRGDNLVAGTCSRIRDVQRLRCLRIRVEDLWFRASDGEDMSRKGGHLVAGPCFRSLLFGNCKPATKVPKNV